MTRSVARFLCNNRASSWLFVVCCSSTRCAFNTRHISSAAAAAAAELMLLYFRSSLLLACFVSSYWHWTKCSSKILLVDVLAALLIVGCRKSMNEKKNKYSMKNWRLRRLSLNHILLKRTWKKIQISDIENAQRTLKSWRVANWICRQNQTENNSTGKEHTTANAKSSSSSSTNFMATQVSK